LEDNIKNMFYDNGARARFRLIWLKVGSSGGRCEDCSVVSGCVEDTECFEWAVSRFSRTLLLELVLQRQWKADFSSCTPGVHWQWNLQTVCGRQVCLGQIMPVASGYKVTNELEGLGRKRPWHD
jgi:hypothetical protein